MKYPVCSAENVTFPTFSPSTSYTIVPSGISSACAWEFGGVFIIRVPSPFAKMPSLREGPLAETGFPHSLYRSRRPPWRSVPLLKEELARQMPRRHVNRLRAGLVGREAKEKGLGSELPNPSCSERSFSFAPPIS